MLKQGVAMVPGETSTADALRQLDLLIEFLRVLRETHWSHKLEVVRDSLAQGVPGAVRDLAAVFEGNSGLKSLYLSGPRFGHSLSERQEIEANGKLHVMRTALQQVAQSLSTAVRT